MNPQEQYLELVSKRDLLKRIVQLSWNINQFERRYPLEQTEESDFPILQRTYDKLLRDVIEVAESVKSYEKDKNTQ